LAFFFATQTGLEGFAARAPVLQFLSLFKPKMKIPDLTIELRLPSLSVVQL
jgi:hypothetical protein